MTSAAPDDATTTSDQATPAVAGDVAPVDEAREEAGTGVESSSSAPADSSTSSSAPTAPSSTDGADAEASAPPSPSVTPGQVVRFTRAQTGVSPDPQVAAIVLSVTPADGDRPERVRVAELGRETVLEAARIRSV